ncbi:MAG: CRISPR-associated endonuclease Cas2 [Mariprofundales bacterium]|nr:CRISPR-associated endonuclease Cas2 [Mariprofundales bacterium]
MALNRRMPVLICYDIANPKRLQRLHRLISQQAVMVQYSVYYAEKNSKELATLAALVRAHIDPRQDDVRIYRLPSNPDIALLGIQASPCLPVLEFHSRVRQSGGGDDGCTTPTHRNIGTRPAKDALLLGFFDDDD